MKNICFVLLKPHAIGTEAESDLFNLLRQEKLETMFEATIEVTEDLLRASQPILQSGKVPVQDQQAIIDYSLGTSKIFLISGECVFEKCSRIKWVIRDKYSPSEKRYEEGKIHPFFVHCSNDFEDTERDVLAFAPEKIKLVRYINRRVQGRVLQLT